MVASLFGMRGVRPASWFDESCKQVQNQEQGHLHGSLAWILNSILRATCSRVGVTGF